MNLLATYIATSLASVPWTAERVAEKAVERSPEIMAAAAERRSAGASTEAAESLLLPRVQLSARYTRLSRIENDPLVALGVDFDAARANVAGIGDVNTRDALKQQIGILEGLDGVTIGVPTDQYSLNASVTLPISQVLFEALPALQAAKRGEQASDLEIAAARHAVALGAVEAYYQHFLAQRALRIAELSVASATT
ncbi:MAG: TolC family protein, partial [Myxococcota bacterium]